MSRIIPHLQVFLMLVFFSLLILSLDSFKLLNLPKQAAFYITNPISFGIYSNQQKVLRQFYFIFASRKASQENRALKEQLGQLLSENANLRKKLLETEALLDQKLHLDPQTFSLVAARPVGLSRFLKIDKGGDGGIEVGQAVVFKDNLIGKIVQVSQKASNVQILQDPDSKVAAFSQGLDGRAKGVLVGQFGTEALLDKILHEEQISVGDLVYTDGTEGNLVRGLVLGRVNEVLERENEVFKQAKVQPVFDIKDLDLVFVIQE